LSNAPGYCAGYGPLDAEESRDVASALARRAGNKWCLTITDPRGRPVAHGCSRVGSAGTRRSARPATDPGDGPTTSLLDGSATGPRNGPAASSRDGPTTSPHDRSPAGHPDGPATGPRDRRPASSRDGPTTGHRDRRPASSRDGPATGHRDRSPAGSR